MIADAVTFEHGLTIPDEQIPAAICKLCKKSFVKHSKKDWVYCPTCGYGFSRVKVANTAYLSSLPDIEQRVMVGYHDIFLNEIDKANSVWNVMTKDETVSKCLAYTEYLTKYVRVAFDLEQASLLERWSPAGYLKLAPPFLVMKLEDAPGRITGFCLVKISHSKTWTEVLTVVDNPKIGFLPSDNQVESVLLEDPALVIRSHAYQASLGKTNLPLGYLCTNNLNFRNSDIANHTAAFTHFSPDSIAKMPKINGKTYSITHRGSEEKKVNAPMVPALVEKALLEGSHWSTTIARNLIKLPWELAAALLNRSKLPGNDIQEIAKHLPAESWKDIEASLLLQKFSRRLPEGVVVFNEGNRWVDINNRVILGANLVVKNAVKQGRNVTYHCELQSKDWTLVFTAGRELEKRAFDVLLRECMVNNVQLEFDRRYSKYALELSTFLNPSKSCSETSPVS